MDASRGSSFTSKVERSSLSLASTKSSEVKLMVGVPQGSVLGPVLLAIYCSQVDNIITDHGECQYSQFVCDALLHRQPMQYADDTQLHLAMRSDNTADGLSVLAAFIADVRQWYMQNGLQLNPDKSEAVVIGTAKQVQSTHVKSVNVAGVDLPVAEEMKVLGVVLDWRLTFDKHVSALARSCNYHAQAIRHIRHLLTRDLAQALAYIV